VGWKVKQRERYALVEEDSEDARKHRGTFYIGPRHVKHHSTKDFVEFSYVTAPNFASQKNCKAFAQNSHCAIEIYDKYAILFDPDYTRKVCVEHWTPQVKIGDQWANIDLGQAAFSGEELADGVKITRRNDVFRGEDKVGELGISWILRTGALLKHEVRLTNLTGSSKTLRMVETLMGIAGKRVVHDLGEEDVTLTEKEKLSRFVRFVDKDNLNFQYLHENLDSLGHEEENTETGETEWVSDELRAIRFKLVDYEGKSLVCCDIVIGNYTLGSNESLFIDPDSDTWQVSAGNDDASEYGSGGFYKADNYNRVHSYTNTSSSNYICCGVRFTSVNIGQGDTIDSADVKLYTYSTSYDDMNGVIYGNDVDNAQDFSDNAHIISTADRPRTSASVSWVEYSIGAAVWATKSVTNIIQEIVNREGWTSNNALVLLFIANTDVSKIFRAKAYEKSTTQCPKLEVEWTSGGAPETYTRTWQTNVLFEKLGIAKTLPIDAAFKKSDVPKTYLMDTLFGKTFEKSISLDAALKRLNIPKQWMIDAAFQKAVLKTLLLDTALKKEDVKTEKQLSVLFKKLDLLKQYGVDADFLKKDIVKSFAIDTYFGVVVTHVIQRQIDVLLRKTGVTQMQVDALFRKMLPICADVTAVFKKLDILKTFGVDTALLKENVIESFGVDAWFGTVCAVAYSKNFGLDVVFRYKVKFPTPLGITLNGQLVIPLRKEVWVKS
jgi:hypothetical protein